MSDTLLVCRVLTEKVYHRDRRQTEVCRTSVCPTSGTRDTQNRAPCRVAGRSLVEWTLQQRKLTVCVTLRLAEARAILR